MSYVKLITAVYKNFLTCVLNMMFQFKKLLQIWDIKLKSYAVQ
jgi:hypothetical protein